jgi:hypothetical protein
MANEKGWKGGRLGSFHLSKRYKGRSVEAELGRLYEAHNIHTGASALVLMPGAGANWEPQESWEVRVSSRMDPPHLVLQVERAPTSGRIEELVDVLDLLTSALERVEDSAQVRAHLTGVPVSLLRRWAGRTRRLLRSRRGLVAGGLTVLALGTVLWVRLSGGPEEHTTHGVASEALSQLDAPGLIDTETPAATAIAYPLPEKPFRNQAAAPCKPNLDEVEINGGCWVTLERRPPCKENQAEHQGKCYMAVSKDRGRREPQSIHP